MKTLILLTFLISSFASFAAADLSDCTKEEKCTYDHCTTKKIGETKSIPSRVDCFAVRMVIKDEKGNEYPAIKYYELKIYKVDTEGKLSSPEILRFK
jgi:hypothetical protein